MCVSGAARYVRKEHTQGPDSASLSLSYGLTFPLTEDYQKGLGKKANFKKKFFYSEQKVELLLNLIPIPSNHIKAPCVLLTYRLN